MSKSPLLDQVREVLRLLHYGQRSARLQQTDGRVVRQDYEPSAIATRNGCPKYRVMIDDNFHYMDEDERCDSGTFKTYEEAVSAAKEIVDRSLRWERGQSKNPNDPDELYSSIWLR